VESPLIKGRPTDAELNHQLLAPAWRPPGSRRAWRLALAITGGLTLWLVFCISYTVGTGIGVWGNLIPIAWAFAIINFVWWIGIGHAGTFISAILLLFEQGWRTSINRFAEGMTLFAVIQAALFPLLHLGRPWFGYWLFPYPATMQIWPQVRSPLPWDAAAITTYFTVSLLFWYVGLVPDFASLRDGAPGRRRRIAYGILALGWRGDASAWRHYRTLYLILAGLATPLVVSVHSIVSSDFAVGNTPGWHSTIFPPFFVAGAIFSGFAMVLTLIIPVRAIYKLHHVITERHLENMAKLLLVTGLLVTYGYVMEFFFAWYSGSPFEIQQYFQARPFGPDPGIFWAMIVGNVVVPQLFWVKRLRRNVKLLFVASILINVGMWAERYVIIVISLTRDFLPAIWRDYSPSWVDIGILVGTLGFFSFLFLIFLRFIPFVPVAEVKEMRRELVHEEQAQEGERHEA
jgi:molybdopterin-containing oxidoreductase family membrane subunit